MTSSIAGRARARAGPADYFAGGAAGGAGIPAGGAAGGAGIVWTGAPPFMMLREAPLPEK